MAAVGAAASSGGMVGGRDLRTTPCSSRISGVDHGAEKRPDGFFLFADTAGVGALY